MENIKLNNLKDFYNQKITINGFVDSIRNLQYVIFLVIRDSFGKVQVTIEKENNQELVKLIEDLKEESTVKITGTLMLNEKVKLGGHELIPDEIIITSHCLEELPFNYKDSNSANLDTRLDYRFLDLRNEKNNLIFRIQSSLVQAMREYCYQQGLTEIHTPKLIGTASESGSEVFAVKYFNRKAYLAQSPQFYKQMAMAAGFPGIFEVAPCYRAENSNTNRHTTEFTSFDVEISNINSYDDVMNFEQDMIIYALKEVSKKYQTQIKNIFDIDINIPTINFPKVNLNDLCEAFKKEYNYQCNEDEQYDLSSEGERLASRFARDKYNSDFIFVTGYPAKKRAFYHMRDEQGILLGYDLIWNGVEITSGAQREHRYEIIKKQAEEKGLNKDVDFYLQFFKYGCPPHGGFAIGIDRLTMLLLGIPTIKEAMFLFRGPNRLYP